MKNKLLVIVIILTLLFLYFFPLVSGEILFLNRRIYVDDDNRNGPWDGSMKYPYPSIQDGIDASNDGDTVFVYKGIYFENIIVDKTINLIGVDRNNTIIDGGFHDNTITINAKRVSIKNFTITGGGATDGNISENIFKAGIRITNSDNIVNYNIIKDNRLGILCLRASNLTIINNIFLNDSVTISPYENDGRPKNKMNYFMHTIENNFVNGKPLYYYKNNNNFIVPSNVGQLIIINCSNMLLKNANIQECDNGILMAYCTNCKIENSTILKNDGIWTFQSSYNTFQFNNLSNNILHGITLDYSSNNNIIINNHISNNKMVGVMIEWYSKNNLITKNNLISNYYNGYQIQSFMNRWCNNYWYSRIDFLNKPLFKFIPRIIFGNPYEQIKGFMTPITIDCHPAKEPYDIL